MLKKNITSGLNSGLEMADGWNSAASGGGTPQPDMRIQKSPQVVELVCGRLCGGEAGRRYSQKQNLI